MADPLRLAVVAGRPLNPWDVVIYRELGRFGIRTTILGSVNENLGVPTVPTVALRDVSPWNKVEPFAYLGGGLRGITHKHGIRVIPSPFGFDDATVGLRGMLRGFDVVLPIETHRASTYQACQSHPVTMVRVSENIPNNPPQFPAGWFRKTVARRAARFVCQTELAKRALREEGVDESKLVVIPETVDTDMFRPAAGPRRSGTRLMVGFAGTLDERHGVLDLVDAFAGLAKRLDASLRIAGEGPLGQSVRSRILQDGLGKCVELLGRLKHTQMPEFLRSIDVLCMPYYETSEWKPQFGVVNLEAMACETPVVTTNAGSVPEILPPDIQRFMVAPGDVHGLAECLQALLTDTNLREGLGRHAREWVLRRYDPKVLGPQWARLLMDRSNAS